jgi:hypothetical protein
MFDCGHPCPEGFMTAFICYLSYMKNPPAKLIFARTQRSPRKGDCPSKFCWFATRFTVQALYLQVAGSPSYLVSAFHIEHFQ